MYTYIHTDMHAHLNIYTHVGTSKEAEPYVDTYVILKHVYTHI